MNGVLGRQNLNLSRGVQPYKWFDSMLFNKRIDYEPAGISLDVLHSKFRTKPLKNLIKH